MQLVNWENIGDRKNGLILIMSRYNIDFVIKRDKMLHLHN